MEHNNALRPIALLDFHTLCSTHVIPNHHAAGIAFILYKTRSAARSAVLLDGHELGGRKIRVTRVKASAVGAGASAWQGATAGPKRRGVAAAGVAARSAKGPAKKLKRASEGKRPAVAARKARTLAKAARRA